MKELTLLQRFLYGISKLECVTQVYDGCMHYIRIYIRKVNINHVTCYIPAMCSVAIVQSKSSVEHFRITLNVSQDQSYGL